VGCANGELLYYLQDRFPNWDLYGYDIEASYLETAHSVEELEDVTFIQKNLFDITRSFDLLLSSCFLLLFQDIEPPLKTMIDLCTDSGSIVSTGLFNPHGIDVRVEYRDNNHQETKGTWRTDYNRHSQQTIHSLFDEQVSAIKFEPCPFNVDIEPDPDHPLRVWTVRDADGNRIIRNGAGQILNQTLMTIHV
jgi:trans-aconitate methyltransferase